MIRNELRRMLDKTAFSRLKQLKQATFCSMFDFAVRSYHVQNARRKIFSFDGNNSYSQQVFLNTE